MPHHLTHRYVCLPPRFLMVLCVVSSFAVPSTQALDNIGGNNYGTIGPVMDYDPATGTSNPFYPVGWYYWWPTDSTYVDEVAASGGNTVLFPDCKDDPSWLWLNTQNGLHRAEQLGVKVIIGLHSSLWAGVDCSHAPSYWAVLRWINEFKDHPALLGWQLGDENGVSLAPAANETICAIRTVDPHNPTWQVFPDYLNNSEIATLMAQTDVASFDRYGYFDTLNPTPTSPFGEVDTMLYLQNMRAGAASVNGWAGNVNVTQGLGPDVGTLDFYRFPSFDEYRHLVFAGIASAGTRGVLSWIYHYGIDMYSNAADFTDWRDAVARPIQLEQQMISHAMETGWNVGTVTSSMDGQTVNGNYNKVSYLLIYDDIEERYYFIVSNNTYDTHNVTWTLSNLPVPLVSLEVHLPEDDETILMTDLGNGSYSLVDTLGDHDVNMYTLETGPGTQIFPVPTGPVAVIEFQIDTVEGLVYNLDRSSDLTVVPAGWVSTGSMLVGDGGLMRMYDRVDLGSPRYHRIRSEHVVSGGLLLSFDANDDNNANDGWSYTGFTSGSLPTAGAGAAPTHHTDPNGQSYFHHDANDRVFLGDLASSTGYGSWTIEYWTRRTGLNSENHVAMWRANPSSGNPSFISHAAKSISIPSDGIDLDHQDGANQRSMTNGLDAVPWPTGEWAQIVVTYEDETGVATDNGIMRAFHSNSSGFNATPVFESLTEPVNNDGPGASSLSYVGLFGQNTTETDRGMVGDLAVVRFYDHVLTTDDMEQNFKATGPGLGLIAAAPPLGIAAVSPTDSMAHVFTGEPGETYELHGSSDGTNFTATGAMVRGDGGQQSAFDPAGTQQAAYQMIRQE